MLRAKKLGAKDGQRTRCWGQAAKTDSAAAGMGVMAAEARSRDTWKVDMAVAALVVAAQPKEDEEEEEAEAAAGSGAACSTSLGQTPHA